MKPRTELLWNYVRMLEGISTCYLNQLYPGEWVLAQVLNVDANQRPSRIKVLAHSPNRQEIHPVMMRSRGHLVLLFVAAPSAKYVTF